MATSVVLDCDDLQRQPFRVGDQSAFVRALNIYLASPLLLHNDTILPLISESEHYMRFILCVS